jgi:UDP-glucose 4-epimerase
MIGTALVERFYAAGHDAVPVDRVRNRWSAYIDAETRPIDLLQPPQSYDLPPSSVDVVVHCAANARVHDLALRPGRALENIMTCGHALEYARLAGARFVFTSSREIYGNQERPQHSEEDATLDRVEGPYAASKLAGEALVQSYRRVYGMPATILRLSNVYGRYDLSERFIPACVKAALTGSVLTIYGQEKRLDFTYVDDVLDVLQTVTEQDSKVAGEVFNVATGHAFSLVEAAELVAQTLEREIRMSFEPARLGEVTTYEADISKAAQQLGYEPKYTLPSALPLAMDWYRQQYRTRPRRVI